MTTREEHLEFCKQRAREYLDRGELQKAVTSMLSDLGKHAETREVGHDMTLLGMHAIITGDMDEGRRFIEGFR